MVGRGGPAPDVIRVLVAPGALHPDRAVALDDDELHHLRVRRAHAGDNVIAYDGAGTVARGVLEADDRRFEVQVHAVESVPRPGPLVAAVAAGDRDRYLRLVEQCTELGVTRLVPLVTARVHSVDSRIRDTALEKARRRAREACKQSGNPWATEVEAFVPLEALATRTDASRWFLADPGGGPLPAALEPSDGVAVLIGPEGGLTADEVAWASEHLGAQSFRLGPHILRFETAAVAALALLQDRRTAPGSPA